METSFKQERIAPWFKFWPQSVPYHIDYPEIPLPQLVTEASKKYSDNIAFNYREFKLSYNDLETITTKLALALNIRKGDRVLLFLANSLQFVIGYYSILKAGGIVVPTNPLLKGLELEQRLNNSMAKMIITNKEFYPAVKEIGNKAKIKTLLMPEDKEITNFAWVEKLLNGKSLAPVQVEIEPRKDVATIIYTGGTTAIPKGVMLTHYNLVVNAIQNATWFGWSPKDIVIGLLPFYHSWGASTCLNSAIYAGARVVVLPRFDAKELLETIEKERATVLYGAASLFALLVSSPFLTNYDLSSLRYVKAGAMPIPVEIKERWEKLTGVKMILGYGLTEASPETHNSPPERVKPGTIGIPIIDTDARVVDIETGRINLPPGQVGELIIKGPQVMKGYWRNPQETKQSLRRGWLYTGDLATMDEEGYFRIVDRKKDIIKYKGYTIAPAELENVIYMHPAVKECAVVGKPDPIAGEIPKAYIVLREGYCVTETEIIKFCEERLAPYKKIREVEFIAEIPKTAVGKILRRILRDKDLR